MKEIFKLIPNYKNYQISNYGNILSLNKNDLMKPYINQGRKQILLYKEGKRKKYYIHQLVAMAFLNHKPCGLNLVVDHIDNNPLNNRLDNLQLISQRENSSKDKTDVGISWNKRRNKWRVSIKINGKQKNLGRYVEKQDALNAYQNALNKIYE
tara:strand:- start:11 stop:469 length:459 start_codon:yes stop_codon:yes gene_type:complete